MRLPFHPIKGKLVLVMGDKEQRKENGFLTKLFIDGLRGEPATDTRKLVESKREEIKRILDSTQTTSEIKRKAS